MQIQLSDDTKFIIDLLGQQIGQVSDSESSISEADCEALINSFEQDSFNDSTTCSTTKQKKSVYKIRVSDAGQQVINVQILAQL